MTSKPSRTTFHSNERSDFANNMEKCEKPVNFQRYKSRPTTYSSSQHFSKTPQNGNEIGDFVREKTSKNGEKARGIKKGACS